jgi:hypothetical protein
MKQHVTCTAFEIIITVIINEFLVDENENIPCIAFPTFQTMLHLRVFQVACRFHNRKILQCHEANKSQ